jgi:hypothetical protein
MPTNFWVESLKIRPLGRPTHAGVDNIKVYLKELG